MTEHGTGLVTMTPAEFREHLKLLNYSHSNPTGVVAGKRWRADRRGKHYLCGYVERDGEMYLTRRVVVVVPEGAVIEAVFPAGADAYWLARHRGSTVSYRDLGVVADQLWAIDARRAA